MYRQQMPGRLSHLQGCVHLQRCFFATKVNLVNSHSKNAYLSIPPLYIFTGKELEIHSGLNHLSGPDHSTTWYWPTVPFFVISAFWLLVTRRQHSTRLRQQATVWWKLSSSALHCLEVSRPEATAKLCIFNLGLTSVLNHLFQIQLYTVNTTEVTTIILSHNFL